MKANTMILAVLLFISALGNILLVINPENASKVHNLMLGASTSSSKSSPVLNIPAKPVVVVKKYVLEVEVERSNDLIISDSGYNGNYLAVFVLKTKNISKKPQTLYTKDFYLVDEEGNEYLPDFERFNRAYGNFYNLDLNPGVTKSMEAVNFIIPSDSKKKYTLCTNKDYIKLTTSKNEKK